MELLLLCWKPIKLLHFPVIYPVGLLHPMSAKISAAFLVFFQQLISVVERNFRILSIENANIKKTRIITYSLVALTDLSLLIAIPSWGLMGINDDRGRTSLETKVADVNRLLKGM